MLDLNATVDRLRAGTPGNRFETVDFRSDGGIGGAVTSSSDIVKTSMSPQGDEEDDEDDIAATQLDDPEPTVTSQAWDMAESSPC